MAGTRSPCKDPPPAGCVASVREAGVGTVRPAHPALRLLPVLHPAERGQVEQRIAAADLVGPAGKGRVGVEVVVEVASQRRGLATAMCKEVAARVAALGGNQ